MFWDLIIRVYYYYTNLYSALYYFCIEMYPIFYKFIYQKLLSHDSGK